MTLEPVRKFVTPLPNDTWESVADRVFPDLPQQEAVERLQSWNLHMLAGRKPRGAILGSDVIFVGPPTEKMRHMFPGKKGKT